MNAKTAVRLGSRGHARALPVHLAVLLPILVVPWLPMSYGLFSAIVLGMVYAVVAVGLDVFAGYAGQMSFGNFGFVAVGAYSAALVSGHSGLSPWWGLPASLLAAGFVALIIGIPMVRLPHLGSALVTFFFAFIVVVLLTGNLLLRWTHGEDGLISAPLKVGTASLDQGAGLFYLTWAVLLIAVLMAIRYGRSRAGLALRVIKRNEIVAETLGVNVATAKLSAFMFSAMVAGLAGFVYGQSLGFLSPSTFDPTESIYIVAMVVVGGLGTVIGPVVGALFFTLLGELALSAGAGRELIFAVVLLIALVSLPSGLYGGLSALRMRARTHGSPCRNDEAAEPRNSAASHRNRQLDIAPRDVSRLDGGELRPPLVQVRDLRVEFGGVHALDQVTFDVSDGAVHAIIGPNGAGKTTLLNCLTGVQTCHGEVTLGGVQVSGLAPRRIRRLGVARTFQHPSLAPDLPVRDNVALGHFGSSPTPPIADVIGLGGGAARRRSEARDAADAALDLVGVAPDRRGVPASALSLAEHKIADVARALAGQPRLLLLDEPTAGLESEEMRRMAEVLDTVHESGTTILVISHHIGFLRELATTATVLDFGRVLADGPLHDVTSRDDVVSVFLGGVAHG